MNILFKDIFREKTVLVTGHTGFKGSWLSLWLQKMEARVIGYSLEPPTDPSLFKLADVSNDMISIIGDVRDYDHLLSVLKKYNPEIIIHMAAQPLVRQSYLDPLETYSTNVLGTVHLLEAVRQTSSTKAIINVTSDKCYENKEWMWGYRENERLGGHDPYSSSKACSELVTQTFRDSFFPISKYDEHGVALASARAGNVIGGGDWAKDRLIPDCIRAFLKKEKVSIRNPYSIRPWQHVLEPLSGYLLLAKMLYVHGADYAEAWNFGPDSVDERSVLYIVEYIASLWNEKTKWELNDGLNLHESNLLKLDYSKAKLRLKWAPCWNLDTTLDKTVEWYKAYKNHRKDLKEVTLQQILEYERFFKEKARNESKKNKESNN